MRVARRALLVVHLAGLSLGLLLAIAATHSLFENMATDAQGRMLSRAALAVTLSVVTASFCFTLARRGFTMVAPPAFAAAFTALAITVGAFSSAAAKGFAPAAPAELPELYATGILSIAVALVVAVAGWIWTYRASRFPLL